MTERMHAICHGSHCCTCTPAQPPATAILLTVYGSAGLGFSDLPLASHVVTGPIYPPSILHPMDQIVLKYELENKIIQKKF